MKTLQERAGRSRGRTQTAPASAGLEDGPSPFLSRPASPDGLRRKAQMAEGRYKNSGAEGIAILEGSADEGDTVRPADQPQTVDDGSSRVSRSGTGYTHQSSSYVVQDTSRSPLYPPSRSVSGIRPLAGGSPSFMMGSWAGYSSKAGIVGMGSHSLMQMINAIGLDAAREEEEDATEATSPSLGTASPVRHPASGECDDSAGGSEDDERDALDSKMRATVANHFGARRHRKDRWMSSSIDAIHNRMPAGQRTWPKPAKLPTLSESLQVEDVKPHIHLETSKAHQSGSSGVSRAGDSTSELSPINSEQLPTDASSTTLDAKTDHAESPSPPQSIILDEIAGQYDTLDDEETRRAILAQKLQDVFELPAAETVLAEYPGWLFRSVLLQGFLYLTEGHLCFYAYLKGKEGQVIRSGSMYRRYPKSIIQTKYWFILKDDVLSWYSSSSNPYFPVDHVPLHYVTSIEPSPTHDDRFKIVTPNKVFRFAAESAKSQQEWVKLLRKVAFRSQSVEDSVKLVIPLTNIAKVEVAENLEFAKATMRVEAIEMQIDGSLTPDDYYFSFAGHPHEVVEQVEEAVVRARHSALEAHRSSSNTPQERHRQGDEYSLAVNGLEDTTQAQHHSGPARSHENSPNDQDPAHLDFASQSTLLEGYTYPPGTSYLPDSANNASSGASTWARWARRQPRKVLHVPTILPFAGRLPFTSWIQASRKRPQHTSGEAAQSDDDGADMMEETDLLGKEREFLKTTFGLSDAEEIIYSQRCYISRGVPVYGTLYVTSNYACFKSQSILTKTKMILPLREIIVVQKAKPLRFDYSGLVLVIRGHEELFFEIGSAQKRDNLLAVVNHQIRLIQDTLTQSSSEPTSQKELKALEALSHAPQSPDQLGDVSQIMFNSATSSFVTFQPPKPLHITCLTVGSRGDVQPYIALCCGLKKEGHTCRIASHPEYRSWVESYGIEFRAVGGDPAELMRICVENGMFTVSFLREGVAKFRGWLEDLLASSWDACQGTELLIESPSTMAGVHIAEALQIPFFRAFTMPWTRTRAYPHAFAVPEVKMGGGYNYMTYTIFDQVFWLAISGQINRWRKSLLHLHATTAEKLELHKVPFLYNFSPTVVPPPMDWMEYIHVCGYWHLDNADVSGQKWEPPVELLDFMSRARAAGKKLVYIGFGSIVVSDPGALTSTILEAVDQAGVWAIISKGWSDRLASDSDSSEAKAAKKEKDETDLGLLPEHVFNIASIPHDWLFPRVDAVCHHGGAGTTGASLRAGKPTIIKPFFGDQAFWAERVESLHVGTALRKMTVPSLANALHVCTSDAILIESAKRLGEQIKQENGVSAAIEAIYRDLDYARSLIKGHSRLFPDALANSPPQSPRESGHEGAVSDSSSGWDVLSERASSAHMSDQELDENHSGALHEGTADRGGRTTPLFPLRHSASDTIKRTLSRANSILPASLLARRRPSQEL